MELRALLVAGCAMVALIGCGSSSSESSSARPTSTPTPTPSAQDLAARQVCTARDGIQTQVQTLSSLSAGNATKANVTSALTAITADLQTIKTAQPDLAPERKQQVQKAATGFETQLTSIVRQTAAGLSKTDAKTQATTAAASLKTAVEDSLQPIPC